MTVQKDYHRRSHVPEHLQAVHSGIDVPSRRQERLEEINSPGKKILKELTNESGQNIHETKVLWQKLAQPSKRSYPNQNQSRAALKYTRLVNRLGEWFLGSDGPWDLGILSTIFSWVQPGPILSLQLPKCPQLQIKSVPSQ